MLLPVQHLQAGAAALKQLLDAREVASVDWCGWERIDQAELAGGAAAGKVREKVVRLADLLQLAGVRAANGSSSTA
jgi:hypothetical protein